ncbi:MAG: nucleotide-binding universal stress UspA family protein [Flavobacteriales bacterium]|jgi:nucleotide-binding universal stress UspA family protein
MSKTKEPIILVPTDFTEEAENAVAHAAKIAKAGGDEVRLIHIVNNDTKSKLKKAKESLDDLRDRMQKMADAITAEHGIKADYHLREGSIFSTIGEVAEETNARLLVMGTHGVKGVQRIVGAFAVKVITTSPVPVIIVQRKRPADHGIKNIVSPIDHSRETKQKIIHIVSMAKKFDSEVHLFASYESDEFLINARNNNIAWAENLLRKNGVSFRVDHAESSGGGHAKQSIKYASEVGADMLVILTDDGDVSVTEFVLGPDHEKVINNDAQIPVMCVNPIQELYHIGNVLFS